MSLVFSKNELFELMQDFYTLTGIRIVLFDDTCTEIFSYPGDCIPFCACMRKNPEFYKMCRKSDEKSFEICRQTKSFHMYKCHAGLIECTAPILDKNTIIGYIMFGQVTDETNRDLFRRNLTEICRTYALNENTSDIIDKIKFKKAKQITAASKILEACVSYILYKEMVKPSRAKLFTRIDEYISTHLSEDLNVDHLCKTFGISRTRLYELMSRYVGGGISAYIKTKRLDMAKELLQSTNLAVAEIATLTGFSDYNYFLRSFKKHFGTSTKEMKNKIVL